MEFSHPKLLRVIKTFCQIATDELNCVEWGHTFEKLSNWKKCIKKLRILSLNSNVVEFDELRGFEKDVNVANPFTDMKNNVRFPSKPCRCASPKKYVD